MFQFAFNDLDSEMICPPLLMHHLVTKLQTALFQPGENVVQLGESVDYFYLIVKGQIAIIDNTGCFVLSELGPQSYFGEYQILKEVKSNFTFRTLNQDHQIHQSHENLHSDSPTNFTHWFYRISASDFKKLFLDFPEYKEQFEMRATLRRAHFVNIQTQLIQTF